MNVDIKMIKQLRQSTGLSISECKKALISANGNIDKAIFNLKNIGKIDYNKKDYFSSSEGIIVIKSNDNKILMIEVNTETDFTALNVDFKNFVNSVAESLLHSNITNLKEALSMHISSNESVDCYFKNLSFKFGEKIVLSRIAILYNEDSLGYYNHNGKVASIVSMNINSSNNSILKDVAMHIVAMNPLSISRDEISSSIVDRERKLYLNQARSYGYSDEKTNQIVTARVNNFLDNNSLLSQSFIKNQDRKIIDLLNDNGAKVLKFVRFSLNKNS